MGYHNPYDDPAQGNPKAQNIAAYSQANTEKFILIATENIVG